MLSNFFRSAVVIILFFTTSCGFTVLYDQKDTGLNYEKELASIKIQKSAGVAAQELRTNIYSAINPDHLEEEVKYYLILTSSENISSTFLTSSGSSGRNQINININYQLKSYENDQLIATGSVSSAESYNVDLSRYGNYNTEEFARSNLLKSLSNKIRNLLVQDIITLKKSSEVEK